MRSTLRASLGRLVVLSTLALAACAGGRLPAIDASLPDGEALGLMDPRTALETATGSGSPGVRATALSALVARLPAGELTRWVMQGTYDPEPIVQRRVVEALAGRPDLDAVTPMLVDYALRTSADPYVRAEVAHRLIDAGHSDALEPLRSGWQDRRLWRAAPLALVAMRLGEDAPRTTLAAALANAEVRDEPSFFRHLGVHGDPALVDALDAGRAIAEDVTAGRMAFAQGLLGDAGAKQFWLATLNSEDEAEQLDAVEQASGLPEAERTALLQQARPGRAASGVVLVWLGRKGTGFAASLMRVGTPSMQIATIRAATSVGRGADAVVALGLSDEDAEVRIEASRHAAGVAGEAVESALALMATEDRMDVRTAAYAAMWLAED